MDLKIIETKPLKERVLSRKNLIAHRVMLCLDGDSALFFKVQTI